jgi:hypothetical protein
MLKQEWHGSILCTFLVVPDGCSCDDSKSKRPMLSSVDIKK